MTARGKVIEVAHHGHTGGRRGPYGKPHPSLPRVVPDVTTEVFPQTKMAALVEEVAIDFAPARIIIAQHREHATGMATFPTGRRSIIVESGFMSAVETGGRRHRGCCGRFLLQ